MNVHQSALADEKPNGHSLTEFCDLQRAGLHPPDSVIKRDGRVAPFDIRHIEYALNRCFSSLGRAPQTPVSQIARNVVNILSAKMSGISPTVEDVQDIVEMVLQAAGEFDAAKHYILYRAEHAKKREERPIPLDVRQSFLDSDRYFPTPLQKFQFFDKYSRFNYELGRRETWIETVNRSVDFLYELAGSRLPHETYERVRQGILEMRAMPSMRLLAMAGAAARRNNITIYNCSYQPVESLESFVEALTISMSGCGVGFSVESHYVENFPRIKRQRGVKPDTYVVDDSAEGWADALRYGLEQWFDGGDVRFDISQLRQAGAPLKTKGGRASGPEPLRLMLKFVRSRLLARQGSFLRPLDAHDIMCAVGNAAVSGGMRRTAMVSLFDYDDSEMQECKNGDFERENSQRWNANNSAVWPEGGLTQMEFMKRFLEMIESERGEPGIFNREAAKMMRPERRVPADFGTNPCVTGDTWVAVADGRGRVQMRELVERGADVPVFTVKDEALDGALDGALVIRTMRRPRKTGSNTPIYRVAFADGSSIRVTPNHTFILTDGSEKCALDLQPNDAITSLNVVSNVVSKGTKARKVDYDAAESYRVLRYRDLSEAEEQFISRHRHNGIHHAPQTNGVNGVTDLPTVVRNGETYVVRTCEICGKSFEVRLERREQAVCSNACSTKMAQKTCSPHRPHHPHSDQHEPSAPSATHIRLYNDLVVALGRHPMQTEWATFCAQHGISADIPSLPSTPPANDDPHTPFTCWHDLQERAAIANHRVVAVEPDGCEDVYTGTVDETHTFFAIGSETLDHDGKQVMGYVLNRQCGEIILRPWELCNLSSAIARADDTEETLREKVEIATIIGSIQSLATYFPGLRPQWKTNCDEERLLGVDITGQMDSPIAQDPRIKAELRQHVVEVNRQVAQSLGINQSAATTCVKPSGNSSQLLNCSSGLHARWAPYYIRNVRVATHSPLFKVLRDAGAPMDPENGQDPEDANTWVVHFPVRSPEGATTRTDCSAVEQCEFWLQNKLNWTEQNPSCFTGDMRFITDAGLRRFDECEDGAPVMVLNADGQWVAATVQALGSQEVWELEVEQCGVKHIIRTTANHLWPISYPMRRFQGRQPHLLRTDQLDRIVGSSEWKLQTVHPVEQPALDLDGVLHGITFGDGAQHKSYQGRQEFCQVYLCNDPNGVDSRNLVELFEEAGYHTIDRQDCDQIRIYGLPKHWKTLPSTDASPEYLRGFVAGWFAADGHINGHTDERGSLSTLSSVNYEALEWLQVIAPRAGLAVSTQIQEHTSNSSACGPTRWYALSLVKKTLDEDFFLLDEKRARFTTARFAKHWKIVSVQNTGQTMPVYCVQEPGEHLFVIEGNILTHNCTITYRPDEVIDLMKWVWDHREHLGGITFLPTFDANYAQMPYEEITKEEYERRIAEFPYIDFSKIYRYEDRDLTNVAQEVACISGSCELDA